MYLGGMARIGKPQVFKVLREIFNQRNESHWFLVVAPTGSAASSLSGSTYHSLFGINDYDEQSMSNLGWVKSQLLGVDYILVDEVSMLSCHDLYRISCRLALALNIPDQLFRVFCEGKSCDYF
jgi:hypothetical protein